MLAKCRFCDGVGFTTSQTKILFFSFEKKKTCNVCHGLGRVDPDVQWDQQIAQRKAQWTPVAARRAVSPSATMSRDEEPQSESSAVGAAITAGMLGGNPLAAGLVTTITGSTTLGVVAGLAAKDTPADSGQTSSASDYGTSDTGSGDL